MDGRWIWLLAGVLAATTSVGAANASAGDIGDRFGARVEELCLQNVFEPIRIAGSSAATRPDDGAEFLNITAVSVGDSTISYVILVSGMGGEWNDCSVGRRMMTAIRANQVSNIALHSATMTATTARQVIAAVVEFLHADETVGSVAYPRFNDTAPPGSFEVVTSGGRVLLCVLRWTPMKLSRLECCFVSS